MELTNKIRGEPLNAPFCKVDCLARTNSYTIKRLNYIFHWLPDLGVVLQDSQGLQTNLRQAGADERNILYSC